MNSRERLSAEARGRSERCRDWLKALMIPGALRPATKEELFAWARENIAATRQNFDAGWVWAIEDMSRHDWYEPLPRRSGKKRITYLTLGHIPTNSYDFLSVLGRRPLLDAGSLTLKRPALTVAPGTTEAAKAHIAAVAERVRLVNRQLKEVVRRLDALVDQLASPSETEPGQQFEQRDAAILRSLPGVGRVVLATLLAEAHQAVQARDYHAMRTLTGVAPVTKRSGKSCRVEMRQACSHRLRSAVYHWARVATQHDARSRARYSALRSRGHSHGRALRGVADRLLAVACSMLSSRTTYDPLKASILMSKPA